MKIAVFIEDSGAPHDTFSIVARELVSGLARGLRPILIRSRPPDWKGPGRSRLHGVPCYSLGRWGGVGHRLRSAVHSAWILRRERADLAHLHLAGLDAWGFALADALRRTPYVLTFHAFSPARFRARGLCERLALRRLLGRARAVTAVSVAARRDLEAEIPEMAGRVRVVPNGLTRRPATSAPTVPPAEGEGRFILSVGAPSFEKGTDLLLFSFADLLRLGRPDLRLVVCGRGERASLFEDMSRRLGVADRVQLLGPLPQERVRSLMDRCLLYAAASREESFGLAVLEAMAAGKAVAAAAVGGLPELVSDGETGLLFAAGSVAGLSAALERLLDDENLRGRLGAAARAASARYSWSTACRAYQDLYVSAMAGA